MEKLFESIKKTIFLSSEVTQNNLQHIYAAGVIYKNKNTFLLVRPKKVKNNWILPLLPISKKTDDMVSALEEQIYSILGIFAVVENIIIYNRDTHHTYPDVCFFARYIGKSNEKKARMAKKFFRREELPKLSAVDTEVFSYI